MGFYLMHTRTYLAQRTEAVVVHSITASITPNIPMIPTNTSPATPRSCFRATLKTQEGLPSTPPTTHPTEIRVPPNCVLQQVKAVGAYVGTQKSAKVCAALLHKNCQLSTEFVSDLRCLLSSCTKVVQCKHVQFNIPWTGVVDAHWVLKRFEGAVLSV